MICAAFFARKPRSCYNVRAEVFRSSPYNLQISGYSESAKNPAKTKEDLKIGKIARCIWKIIHSHSFSFWNIVIIILCQVHFEKIWIVKILKKRNRNGIWAEMEREWKRVIEIPYREGYTKFWHSFWRSPSSNLGVKHLTVKDDRVGFWRSECYAPAFKILTRCTWKGSNKEKQKNLHLTLVRIQKGMSRR